MNKRRMIALMAILAVALIVVSCAQQLFAPESFPPGVTLHATVVNETSDRVEGLLVVDEQGGRISVPAIDPGATAVVTLRNPSAHSENTITLREPNGEEHVVVPYFEYNLQGTVLITIKRESQGKLRIDAEPDVDTSYEPVPQ